MFLVATALLACPVALGALLGIVLRHRSAGRIGGVLAALGCVALPTILALALTLRWPLVGIWDALTESLLCGLALLATAHRRWQDPRAIALATLSGLLALAVLEVGARAALPQPPAYQTGQGPHLLLATALKVAAPDGDAFKAGQMPPFLVASALQARGSEPDERPVSAMATREIVCSIAYGSAYHARFATREHYFDGYPSAFAPRTGATRRVLHIGDSMVYGTNVGRSQTFAAHLERLEAGVQHINGGIAGTAPDDYAVLLQRWVAQVPVDLAVMYLFAGNDPGGLDAPHPCSAGQSLLVYQGGKAQLRFASAPANDGGLGWTWLITNSPLPYLGRVAIVGHCAVAAWLGALLDSWSAGAAWVSPETQNAHLAAILRTVRDDLRARHIPLAIVVLPGTNDLKQAGGYSDHFSASVRAITARLQLPTLDAAEPIRAALARGENPAQEDGIHFNVAGHAMMATWLHDKLAQLR